MAGEEKRSAEERTKAIFRALPIYEAHGSPPRHVSLVEARYLPAREMPLDLLDEAFLRVRGQHTATLLAYLDVPTLPRGTIYCDHLFPRLPTLEPAVRNRAMLEALRELSRLAREDARITSMLQAQNNPPQPFPPLNLPLT